MCDEEYAMLKSTWSPEALKVFVDTWNANRVEALYNDSILKLTVRYYGNNEFTILTHSYTKEYYAKNTDKILRELKREKV